eukprot:gene6920-biopygen711
MADSRRPGQTGGSAPRGGRACHAPTGASKGCAQRPAARRGARALACGSARVRVIWGLRHRRSWGAQEASLRGDQRLRRFQARPAFRGRALVWKLLTSYMLYGGLASWLRVDVTWPAGCAWTSRGNPTQPGPDSAGESRDAPTKVVFACSGSGGKAGGINASGGKAWRPGGMAAKTKTWRQSRQCQQGRPVQFSSVSALGLSSSDEFSHVAAWRQSVAGWRHGGTAAKRGGMAAKRGGTAAWRQSVAAWRQSVAAWRQSVAARGHGGISASGGTVGGMAAWRQRCLPAIQS